MREDETVAAAAAAAAAAAVVGVGVVADDVAAAVEECVNKAGMVRKKTKRKLMLWDCQTMHPSHSCLKPLSRRQTRMQMMMMLPQPLWTRQYHANQR